MATRTISTRLAIEGEAEYRASLTKVNSELKVMQSELKKTETQYKNNATGTEALTAKGKALQNLYTSQLEKVNALRKGLENALTAESEYSRKKDELTKKIQENQKALEELKNASGDTAEQQAQLEAENQKLNEQLSENEVYLTSASKGVNKWKTDLNSAETELYKTKNAIKDNDEALEKSTQAINDNTEATQKQNEAFRELATLLAASGIKKGIDEIVAALKECVEASASFEAAMSNVRALSGATSDEIELLSEKAKTLGATTKFTATEAATAMGYMAMAGWDASEMLDGMDAVMKLAAASGEDLASVSDIVTDNLTAFRLTAKDTAHFSDVLAAAATKSNTSVGVMGETFKSSAALAGTLNYSIEDVAVAIGLMANNGIKGSNAGTALKNMFTGLTDGVTLTSAAFGDIDYSATNADGTMKSFSTTLNELRGYFSQMTEQEQLMNAKTIAGQRAMAGFAAIMNSTEDDYRSLTEEIRNCSGAAGEMADIKLANLDGKLTLLSSATDAVKVSIGERLTPALGELVDTGTDAVTWANDFIQANDWLVPALSATVVGMGAFTVSATALSVATTQVGAAIAAAGKAALANPWILAAAAVLSLGTAIFTMCTQAESSIPKVSELTEKAKELSDALKDAETAFNDSTTGVEAAASVSGDYISRLEELDKVKNKSAEQEREYHALLTMLCETVPELAGYIDLETDSIEGGTQALKDNLAQWKENAKEQARQEQLTASMKAYSEAEVELKKNELELEKATTQLSIAQQKQNDAIAKRAENEEKINALVTDSIENDRDHKDEINALSKEQEDLNIIINEQSEEIAHCSSLQLTYSEAVTTSAAALDEARESAELTENAINNLSFAEKTAEGASTAFSAGLDALTGKQNENSAAVTKMNDLIDDLADKYKEAYDSAYKSISGTAGLFGEFTADLGENFLSIDDMMSKWETQAQNVAAYTENLEKAARYGITDGLVAALSDGSAESAAYLAEIISELEQADQGLSDSYQNAEDLKNKINSAYEGTEEAKSKYAETVAGLDTDLQETTAAVAQAAKDCDFSGFSDALKEAFENLDLDYEAIASNFNEGLVKGLKSGKDETVFTVEEIADATLETLRKKWGIHSPSTAAEDLTKNFDKGLALGVENNISLIIVAVGKLESSFTNKMKEAAAVAADGFIENLNTLPARAENTGEQTINGMIAGLKNRSSALYAEVKSVVNNALEVANETAEVKSPSKRTVRTFEFVGEGMAVGLENKKERVAEAAQEITLAAFNIDAGEVIRKAVDNIDDRVPTAPIGSAGAGETISYIVQSGAVQLTIQTQAKDPEDVYRVVRRRLDNDFETILRSKGGKA